MQSQPSGQPITGQALSKNARTAGVFLWLGLALLALVLLNGCASGPSLSPKRLANLSAQQQRLTQVPFYPQRDYQCGPATLAMVLESSGKSASVDTLIPQVFLPNREGSVQPEMLSTVRRHDRIPFVLSGDFHSLLMELDAGHPVAVMQNLALPAFPMWHYAVVIGYDLPARQLTLHSGTNRARQMAFDRFDATWARADRWAFVALPPGELPASLTADDLLQPISDFEQIADSQQALPAWQAASQRYPEHAMLRFALGNALNTSEDSAKAIQAFREAVARDPELAEAWLNLGLMLAEQRPDEARDALEKAASLSGPWQQQARLAIEALESETR